MTFTCAQAFDANYSNWQKDTGRAALKARASENGDIGTTHVTLFLLDLSLYFPLSYDFLSVSIWSFLYISCHAC